MSPRFGTYAPVSSRCRYRSRQSGIRVRHKLTQLRKYSPAPFPLTPARRNSPGRFPRVGVMCDRGGHRKRRLEGGSDCRAPPMRVRGWVVGRKARTGWKKRAAWAGDAFCQEMLPDPISSPVSPVEHMINRPFKFNARFAGHERSFYRHSPLMPKARFSNRPLSPLYFSRNRRDIHSPAPKRKRHPPATAHKTHCGGAAGSECTDGGVTSEGRGVTAEGGRG